MLQKNPSTEIPAYLGLRKAYRLFGQTFDELKGKLDCTLEQFLILRLLKDGKGHNQRDLIEMSGIDRSTVSQIVGGLKNRGYIAVSRDLKDSRAVEIVLSAEGKRVLKAADNVYWRAERDFDNAIKLLKSDKFMSGMLSIAVSVVHPLSEKKGRDRIRLAPRR